MLLDDSLAVCVLHQVALDDVTLSTFVLFDLLLNLLGAIEERSAGGGESAVGRKNLLFPLLAQESNRHVRSLPHKCERHCSTDAAVTTRDNRSLILGV